MDDNDDGGMGLTGLWSLGVLAGGAENTAPLDAGAERTVAAAWAAAIAASVRAGEVWGRQEFRLQVGGVPVMVVPGLTIDGRVDLDDLRESLEQLATSTSPAPPTA